MGRGKSQRHRGRPTAVALALALALTLPQVWAAADDPFFDLNLKEVLNLEITSVSKKPQTLSQAAAAVFVITGDDIRRTGSRTIAEALRMAPGIQALEINAGTWAVSARGPDGRFTNKLLVLMDGRSVYTPTFSGVYWDVQDTLLADVDRIEIIRGPGAALWGANAVNGVVNIITKSAAATQGGFATVRAGDAEQSAALRYGGKLGDAGHWRAFVKGVDREASTLEATGARGGDAMDQLRAGFRSDFAFGHDAFTLQGDYYRGHSGETTILNFITPPYIAFQDARQKVSGFNVLGRWQRDISPQESFTLQGYVDHTERDWPALVDEHRTTFDLDFQYRSRRYAGHDLVLGAGYRVSRDKMRPSVTGIPANALPYSVFNPADESLKLLSAFVQDDIALVPDKLIATLGAKLENNDYTGLEVQPNVRLLWTPSDATTVWGSVARAVRTPSRIDRGGTVTTGLLPPATALNPLPLPMVIAATADVRDSETLIAYELGWKQKMTPALSIDLALFYNQYDKLRTSHFDAAFCQPSGLPLTQGCFLLPGQTHVTQNAPTLNGSTGRSYGSELSADWRPRHDLRFQLSVSMFSMNIQTNPGFFSNDMADTFAETLGSLRMIWNPRADTDVDLWLRQVGDLVDARNVRIPGYTELDARLAWRPGRNWELALVGRNLLHKRHTEFNSELADALTQQVERSAFAQVNWKF